MNGLAGRFEEHTYNSKKLSKYLTEKEYDLIIEKVNDTLFEFWPCTPCFCIGYLLCPCTLGLSFLAPNICISEAKEEVELQIQIINRR